MSQERESLQNAEQRRLYVPTILHDKALLAPDVSYKIAIDPRACAEVLKSLHFPEEEIKSLKILATTFIRSDIRAAGLYDEPSHTVVIAGDPMVRYMSQAQRMAKKIKNDENAHKNLRRILNNPSFTYRGDLPETLSLRDSHAVNQVILSAGNQYINYILAHELRHVLRTVEPKSRDLRWVPKVSAGVAAGAGAYYLADDFLFSIVIGTGALVTASGLVYSLSTRERHANAFANNFIISSPNQSLMSISPRT